jgi:hypothetical protein
MIAWAQVVAAVLTAVATIALFAVTWVLARETRRMAEVGSQPHVVATLEPGRWSLRHLDLRVANTGNAPAYEVEVSFSPELTAGADGPKQPLTKLSVLRPGQVIAGYAGEYTALNKQKAYEVTVEWRRKRGAAVERNSYTLSLADYDHYGTLGASDPLVQMAQDLRHIKGDLHRVFAGSRRLAVETYTQHDRERQRAERERALEQQRAQAQQGTTVATDAGVSADGGPPTTT